MKLHIYGQDKAGDTAELAMNKEAALELIAALAYAVQNGEFIHQFECGGKSFDLMIVVNDRENFNLPYEEIPPKPPEPEIIRDNRDVDEIPF